MNESRVETDHPPVPAQTDPASKALFRWLGPGLILAAAVIGRLPALGSWWAQDDWGQLGRAAGITTMTDFPVRWLSQHLWWQMTWPVFGLDSTAHALLRLIIHGLSSVLVMRIGRKAGLGNFPALFAGFLFAASPLAFTPLYWASGIQELLAALFALISVDQWLAAGRGRDHSRRHLWLAALACVLSLLSKESGLGLPIFFVVLMWLGIGVRLEDRPLAWALNLMLTLSAMVTAALILQHFESAPGVEYARGGLEVMAGNLGVMGWWLLSPGPVLASNINLPMAVAGGLLFLLWFVVGGLRWRWGQKTILLSGLAAVLVLAPVLPLKNHLVPYLGYLAVAPFALSLGSLLPEGPLRLRPAMIGGAFLLAVLWGFFGMQGRLAHRNELGLVADPVARSISLSWSASQSLTSLESVAAGGPVEHVVLLQPVVGAEAAETADQMGERWALPSDMYNALGGNIGPQLLLEPGTRFTWVNSLDTAHIEALVLCETATGFRVWGRTPNALLYAALTDVGLGHFQRARKHLIRAAALNDETVAFLYDEGQMIIPIGLVLQQKEPFVDWTLGLLQEGASGHEVGGLQDMFLQLLSLCTNRPLEELMTGSRILDPGATTDSTATETRDPRSGE